MFRRQPLYCPILDVLNFPLSPNSCSALPQQRSPAWSVALAIMLLILCVASAGPAIGNVRQLRPSQAANVNARKSPPPTSAVARDGISESATHCPTRFVTAVVPDGHGGVWVSGEDFGIYHGVPDTSDRPDAIGVKAAAAAAALAKHPQPLPRFHWQHFDDGNSPGLASNFITALCVDGRGRLWAGTNRHGVCVFNGKKMEALQHCHRAIGQPCVCVGLQRYCRSGLDRDGKWHQHLPVRADRRDKPGGSLEDGSPTDRSPA